MLVSKKVNLKVLKLSLNYYWTLVIRQQ